MKVAIPVTGGVCQSLQGRDKGCVYAIVSVSPDGSYVYVADGKGKPLSRPKRKNLKHLRLLPERTEDYGACVPHDKADDCAIAYALKCYKQSKTAAKP